MALDDRVLNALERMIKKRKQPAALTKRLSAWLNTLSSDPSTLERPEEVKKHIANVLEAVVIDEETNDDEDQE